MNYFDFNYVTSPPDDEFVDPEKHLNHNWKELDKSLKEFANIAGGVSRPLIGTEAYYPTSNPEEQGRIAVWDGAIWRRALNHRSPWTAWQNLVLRPPVVARPGWPPVAIVDNIAKRIRLSGGVLYGDGAPAWPVTSDVEITNDTAIQTQFAPANSSISVQQCAAARVLTANGFASAVATIRRVSSPDRVAISIRYQGDAGGGNFVMLDGIEWWYD